MNDIDFDEIDRAVQGLTAKKSRPKEPIRAAQIPVNKRSVQQPNIKLVSDILSKRPRTGRFLDVIHPSTDMRKSSSPAKTQANVPNNISSTNTISELITPKAPIEAPEVPEPTRPALDDLFLKDVKIDKRPLGAFSEEAEVKPIEAAPEAQPEVATDAKEEKQPDSPAYSLAGKELEKLSPEELDSQIAKIESTKVADPELGLNKTSAKDSISQQYKAKEDSGDQSNGAIYDTDVYHKVPPMVTKKRSGWFVVIMIVLLAVLCAGAGAAVYYFILPKL